MIVLYILLAALCIGMPVIIILKTNQSQKRGCGRGCATCGDRDFCHPVSPGDFRAFQVVYYRQPRFEIFFTNFSFPIPYLAV